MVDSYARGGDARPSGNGNKRSNKVTLSFKQKATRKLVWLLWVSSLGSNQLSTMTIGFSEPP